MKIPEDRRRVSVFACAEADTLLYNSGRCLVRSSFPAVLVPGRGQRRRREQRLAAAYTDCGDVGQQDAGSRCSPRTGQLLVLPLCLLRLLQSQRADLDHQSIQPLQIELVGGGCSHRVAMRPQPN